MRLLLLPVLLFVAALAAPTCRADEASLREALKQYAESFNAKNLESVMAFWGKNAVHTDRETGEQTVGHDAIREDIDAAFKQRPDMRLMADITQLRLIKPDVASVSGQVTVATPGEDPEVSQFTAILLRDDDQWMIETLEEMPAAVPPTPYDALRELEWLIGTWRDESERGRIDNDFRWSDSGTFLIRSFTADLANGDFHRGTQVIGWDPRSLEIRSWTFNSDGSFGDATWTRIGEDWLIRSSQTLVDGEAASGTFVLTREDSGDQVTLQLIGHEVEGEPRPTQDGVTLTRVSEPVTVGDDVPAADEIAESAAVSKGDDE